MKFSGYIIQVRPNTSEKCWGRTLAKKADLEKDNGQSSHIARTRSQQIPCSIPLISPDGLLQMHSGMENLHR